MDLYRSDIQRFINDNLNSDINDLILKFVDIEGVPIGDIVTQIISKNKAKNKIDSWYKVDGLIYPPPLSIEQCSSDVTGKFKSTLFSGNTALDLTGGAGVDSFYLSSSFDSVDYVEKDRSLVELCRHNFKLLNASNINCHCSFSEDYLEKTQGRYDLIYLDPSRRINDRRVFKLSDCTPDIVQLQNILFERSENVLVKTSPLLDIHKSMMDLKNVKEVIILGVKNEVKEVLYHLSGTPMVPEPYITAVNITSGGVHQVFRHLVSEESLANVKFEIPNVADFIYEPNSSILKAGAFKLSASRWGLNKLHPNTQLNTSAMLHEDYPGRIFRVKEIFHSISKAMNFLKGEKINIITRNHRLKPQELKQKLKTNDGGEDYVIAAGVQTGDMRLFYCRRIK